MAVDEENRHVVIENQFGASDHDHLGKCLTYASHCKADIIIWVAETLRDEHRQAVHYFNKNCPNIEFYVVIVEVFLINKQYTYLFSPYVDKKDWARLHASESVRKQVYSEYHDQLKQELARSKFGLRAEIIYARASYVRQIEFRLNTAPMIMLFHHFSPDDNSLYVGISCLGKNQDPKEKGAMLINKLKEQKDAIEKEIGQKLKWDYPGEIYFSGIPIPRLSELNTLIPKSIDLLTKMKDIMRLKIKTINNKRC